MSTNNEHLRPLGNDGPLVSRLGLGFVASGEGNYGPVGTDEERFAVLDRAVKLGQTFWDLADMYGDSEVLIGKWFKRTGLRDKIFLATKFGYLKHRAEGKFAIESSGEYAKEACEDSLKKLGVDFIDLYYAHNVNPDTPIEDTMRGLKDLQDAGKIKHLGLSCISAHTLRRASSIARVTAVQVLYHPFSRAIEANTHAGSLLSACRELGVAVVVATPLGRGLITSSPPLGIDKPVEKGDIRSKALPHFQPDNTKHNQEVIRKWGELAGSEAMGGITAAQLSLAWLLSRGDDVFPIPGTRRVEYLDQNWGAVDVKLSAEQVGMVDDFVEKNKLMGGDLPKGLEHYALNETRELTEEERMSFGN